MDKARPSDAEAYRSIRRFLWNRWDKCVLSGEQREFIWNLLANFPEASDARTRCVSCGRLTRYARWCQSCRREHHSVNGK